MKSVSQREHGPFGNAPPELQKLHDLYPDMNYDQLLEAWQNLDNYIRVVLRIHERISKTEHPENAPLGDVSSDINTTPSDQGKIVPAKYKNLHELCE